MKKIFFIIVPIFVLAAIFFLIYQIFFNKNSGMGALQVTASPESKIFLDNKAIGQTPYPKVKGENIFPAGEYTLKIAPANASFGSYEEKIKITNSTLTVVDRKFGPSGTAEGSVISLSPLENQASTQLLVISFPEKAEIYLDSVLVGTTPFSLKNVTQSDHKLKIRKSGYKEKIIPIRTPGGYELKTIVYLGIDGNAIPSLTPPLASPSAALNTKSVIILDTPTGFLRVRQEAALFANEIGRVLPGESYEMVEEKTDWVAIKLKNGQTGWISSTYAKKQ